MSLKKFRVSDLYYILVMLGYTLSLYLSVMRPGIFAALLMVLVGFEVCVLFNKNRTASKASLKNLFGLSLVDAVVLTYFIVNLLSVFWLTKNGFSVSVFAQEFSNSILPVVFYFYAVFSADNVEAVSKNSNKSGKIQEGFLIIFLMATVYICIVGIIFNATCPQNYLDYLYRLGHISLADAPTAKVRMNSLIGSTSLGFITVAAMLASVKLFFDCFKYSDNNDKKPSFKNFINQNNRLQIIFSIISFVICLAVAFLTSQRAAMVAALLVILYINWLLVYAFHFIDKKFIYMEIVAVIVIIIAMFVVMPGISGKIAARLISLPGAVGERSESWIAAINNMYGQWFGNGLGANGHKAIGTKGQFLVADGGLIKLYCEEGAIGFGLFVYIIIEAVKNGYKNLRQAYPYIGIIAIALLMSIGSNIISFQLCAPIFWYSLGMCMRKQL